MKLFFAVSYLNRSEWGGETACQGARFGFELLLRECVETSTDGQIAAHVALYFQEVDDALHAKARPLLPDRFKERRSFFVDVLANGHHTLSVWEDAESWYRSWDAIRVDLHEVRDVDAAAIHRAFDVAADTVRHQTRYDSCINLSAVLEWYPCVCTPCCGCCGCCLSPGVNCVGVALEGLTAARGPLGLRRRVVTGARLPSVVVRELVNHGIIRKDVLRMAVGAPAVVPLLVIRM